jgi:hypothetical protein
MSCDRLQLAFELFDPATALPEEEREPMIVPDDG